MIRLHLYNIQKFWVFSRKTLISYKELSLMTLYTERSQGRSERAPLPAKIGTKWIAFNNLQQNKLN